MDAHKLGKKILALRKSGSMTQQQLADMLSVTDKAVSKWETGGGLPELKQIPAIASVFGVTVDDIISDRDLPSKKMLLGRRFATFIRTQKKVIFFLVLAILGLGLIFLNILWTNYISTTFDPFLKNENLLAIPEWNRTVIRSRGRETFSFKDFDGSGYSYEIGLPARFDFGGNISILAPSNPQMNPDFNDHDISLMIFISPGGDWRYVLGLGTSEYREYTDENGTRVHETTAVTFGSAVDRYGQPLGKHPDDSEEDYLYWLKLYEKFNVQIMDMFRSMKDFFGEEMFR